MGMNCEDWKAFQQDYATGTLSDGARAAVDRHLSGCADCAGEVRLLQRIELSLREQADREAPAGLADRVLARSHPVRRPTFRRELVRLAAAAGLLISAGYAALAYAPLEQARPVVELSQSLFESARMEVERVLNF